jgi:hypothetical protein
VLGVVRRIKPQGAREIREVKEKEMQQVRRKAHRHQKEAM